MTHLSPSKLLETAIKALGLDHTLLVIYNIMEVKLRDTNTPQLFKIASEHGFLPKHFIDTCHQLKRLGFLKYLFSNGYHYWEIIPFDTEGPGGI